MMLMIKKKLKEKPENLCCFFFISETKTGYKTSSLEKYEKGWLVWLAGFGFFSLLITHLFVLIAKR
jgi:hypothetical protein